MSGPEKAALAQAAGAEVVLNYKTENLLTAVQAATAGQGVDRIIEVDLTANINTDLEGNRLQNRLRCADGYQIDFKVVDTEGWASRTKVTKTLLLP